MRLVFAGTPEFAERALGALIGAGHDIALVLTQPDRPAGRGLKITESPVKQRARAAGIEILQPATLRDAQTQGRVRAANAEVMVVAAYGLILPAAVLQAAPRGAINIHASLLPRWRGAAPIQRALLAGDAKSGVTIMQMDEGLDTGPMLAWQEVPIRADDDAGTLHDRLAALGAEMIVETLSRPFPAATPQPDAGATYAAKITRADSVLDWARPAAELDRVVRAMRPGPGAQTAFGGVPLKVWRAQPLPVDGAPGEVLRADREGIVVGCGGGALRLLELQRAGGKRLAVAAFLGGTPINAGARLGI